MNSNSKRILISYRTRKTHGKNYKLYQPRTQRISNCFRCNFSVQFVCFYRQFASHKLTGKTDTCQGRFGAGCHLFRHIWCRLPPVRAGLVQAATSCSGIFGAGCHLFRHIWCRLPPVPAGLVQAATCSCRFGAGFLFPQTGLVQTSSCLRILEVSYLIIMYFVAGCHLFTQVLLLIRLVWGRLPPDYILQVWCRLQSIQVGLVQAAIYSGRLGVSFFLFRQIWCLIPPVQVDLVLNSSCSGWFIVSFLIFRYVWCFLPLVQVGLVFPSSCLDRFGVSFLFFRYVWCFLPPVQVGLVQAASWCLFRQDLSANVLPQRPQRKFLAGEWVWRCARRLLRSANDLRQSAQLQGRSPVWDLGQSGVRVTRSITITKAIF